MKRSKEVKESNGYETGLADSLRAVDQSMHLTDTHYYLRCYHTNDRGLAEAYQKALRLKPHDDNKEMMLVVGTGGAISLLPEIRRSGIHRILFIDRDPHIPAWIRYLQKNIANNSWSGFRQKNHYGLSGMQEIDDTIDKHHAKEIIRTEREILKQYHIQKGGRFRNSRYDMIQQALHGVSIFPMCGDLEDKEFMRSIGTTLFSYGLQITLANLTNVYEGATGVDETLPLLPFHGKAVIIWSAHPASHAGVYSQQPIVGVSQYIVRAEQLRLQSAGGMA